MSNPFDIGNIWKNLREVDLRPIRAEAERVTQIIVVGEDDSAKVSLIHALCQEMRRAPTATDAGQTGPDPSSLNLNQASGELGADLIILIVDATKADRSKERELFQNWRAAGERIVVVNNRPDVGQRFDKSDWQGAAVVSGSTANYAFLENEFALAVLALVPEFHLSLARHYPLFRTRVAQQVIAETSAANASYALTTGLAEIIPILNVPFNVADMIVLTKAQAIMAYKLGLALGLSLRWQDHVTAFGGTIGSGFLWRQLARQLVGLIPVWGIIPKVAVAYAGTYVLGQAILQWYLTGRQVTPAMMRQLYRDAFDQGKAMARAMIRRAPRGKKRQRLALRAQTHCANCGSANPAGYNYCGNCGNPLKSDP